MKMTNKVYNALKWVAQIVLPALAVLWYTIAAVWNLPHTAEIETTIIAIDTFLGACLGVSTYQYNKSLSEVKNSGTDIK